MKRLPSPFSFASATQYLVLINIIVYAIQILLQPREGLSGGDVFGLLNLHYITWFERLFAINTPPESLKVIWQVATSMFLHGSFWHILFNMWVLWQFGQALEHVWGGRYFLLYYLLAGIGSGMTVVLLSLIMPEYANPLCLHLPHPLPDNCLIPTLGASGAIFGLLLAYGVLFPNNMLYFFFAVPMQAKYAVLVFGGLEFFFMVSNALPGISHIGHLGGLLAGFMLLKGRSLIRRL